ncbi:MULTISPECIES: glutathione peroxidase [Paenibacillus]|jgi:glutathione peroxidase|uniref:Glutathione peroxidase n=1 Tax=Paenibacillus azoreducens TaxID=116718 RepID=A0A920CRK8_9BACL|nr:MULTISPECIES: glutathione peroxidase [Paenibacillus]MBE9915373.1 glutathione peroxidase [Paenibacillus donghaensis]GIO46513.1 glutathione peroxidase [Paenibacillus azoreducens]
MSVYSFKAKNIRGKEESLSQYEGNVLLIVNTASECGFTAQYSDLQKLYEKYKDRGFTILGFPCNQFGGQEPGSNEDVNTFCQINYGVTFPLFEKTDVRGEGKHPLFAYLSEQAPFKGFDPSNSEAKMLSAFIEKEQPELMEGNDIKWNFTKFLIDRKGNVVNRFESPVGPLELEPAVESLL